MRGHTAACQPTVKLDTKYILESRKVKTCRLQCNFENVSWSVGVEEVRVGTTRGVEDGSAWLQHHLQTAGILFCLAVQCGLQSRG